VKSRNQIEPWRGVQERAFTPALILFIALPENENKTDPELIPFPLRLLPRRCPVCGNRTIVGHGRRRKQAHDQRHDRIWIRRGRCRPCRKTFTILPVWSPPYGHYSLHCRQQAWESLQEGDGWEGSVPNTKEPDRVPDPSTLRRWSGQLFCLWVLLASRLWLATAWNIFGPSTILAWDWNAVRLILPVEVNSS
jgi:hypothetical protein